MKTKIGLSLCFIILSIHALGLPKIVSDTVANAKKIINQHVTYPLYIGANIGYGNTDWSEITTSPSPPNGNINPATFAAPIGATHGGIATGGYVGYQFSRHFTIENIYTHYATTEVTFSQANNYNISRLNTNTLSDSLVGKILVPFAMTKVYVYADAGITYVRRIDKKITSLPDSTPNFKKEHIGHFGPSFGFGVAYNLTQHIFTEGSFQYSTGYGKANARPAENYIPFTYSIMGGLAVRA